MPTLDVLISTFGPDGISRVAAMNPPLLQGVSYIVTWQHSDRTPLPASLASRPDIQVYRVAGHGLSRNRNEGISRSTADIYLIADDDLRFTPEGLSAILDAWNAYPDLDFAAFRHIGPDAKSYPTEPTPLNLPLPKGYYLTSFELTVRRAGRAGSLRYSPQFGIGAPRFGSGEEELFLYQAIKRGARGLFLPVDICTHPGLTTGHRPPTPHILKAQGAIIALYYPLTAPLRIPLKAWRQWRAHGLSPLRSALHMIHGALYSTFILRTPWQK